MFQHNYNTTSELIWNNLSLRPACAPPGGETHNYPTTSFFQARDMRMESSFIPTSPPGEKEEGKVDKGTGSEEEEGGEG